MNVSVVFSTQLVLKQDKVLNCIKHMSTPLHKYVINFIHTQWGSKEYFPGPQPISIERKHFPILKGNEYLVCEKTDGERYMMVAFMYEGKKKCLFVNRSFNMFEVSINLKKSAYDGTILDGELYEGTLMVYDALLVMGNSVWNKTLTERLEKAQELMKSVIYMKSDAYRLKCKTFHHMRDFRMFMDEYLIDDEPWFEDGAIVECKYVTSEEPMWWKPIKRRTDKTYPNNRRTFYRTIVNIKENIQMKEFLDCKYNF